MLLVYLLLVALLLMLVSRCWMEWMVWNGITIIFPWNVRNETSSFSLSLNGSEWNSELFLPNAVEWNEWFGTELQAFFHEMFETKLPAFPFRWMDRNGIPSYFYLMLLNGMNGLERNYKHFSMKCSKRNFQLFPFAEWFGTEVRAFSVQPSRRNSDGKVKTFLPSYVFSFPTKRTTFCLWYVMISFGY